jgi:hypothetical protein
MSKRKVVLNGITYAVDAKHFRSIGGGKEYLNATPPVAGSLVKQFVKAKYPNIVCKVKSESFAGGNSLNVYLCNPNGGPAEHTVWEAINEFAHNFEYGSFNGMYDIYETYDNTATVTDAGNRIEAAVKYVSVYNGPQFNTVEYVLNSVIYEGRGFEEATKYISPEVKAKATNWFRTNMPTVASTFGI